MRAHALVVAAVATLTLAGCGSGGHAGLSVGATLTVYSSLPLSGPQAAHSEAIVDGIRLALQESRGRAGGFPVRYISLDDALPQSGGWEPGQVARNAGQVIQDGSSMALIGDFDSGASAVSIPILNKLGVAQISPASTYTGLTTGGAGAELGEPQKYYPAGRRTFVRLVPRDTVQAVALVRLLGQSGCRGVAVADDKAAFGEGLARLVEAQAIDTGLRVVDVEGVDPDALSYVPYAQTIRDEGADCMLYTGAASGGASALFRDVAAALPSARLFASNDLCDAGFAAAGGPLPQPAARHFRCVAPPLGVFAYPGGRAFAAAYLRAYGRRVADSYALYGYEAMRLVLDTIRSLGGDGGSRDAFLPALMKTHDRSSPLGRYSITPAGDSTLGRYGVYRLGGDGDAVYVRALRVPGA